MILVTALAAAIPVMASTDKTAGVSDLTVKVLVESELARRGLAKNAIEVSVDDHIVTLSGTVSTLAERERIEQTARKTDAVSGVQNHLLVGVASDMDIAKSVRKAILTNANYDAFDWVDAQVHAGVVTLSGWVREPWRKREFEKQMMNIAGVSKIDNGIKELPLSTYDDEIRIRVARTLYGSSMFNRYAIQANPPIHIIVDHGRVVLKGIVANTMDRQVAESMVRLNSLALDVKNELQVEID
jgi:hyperosmotically inducible protein